MLYRYKEAFSLRDKIVTCPNIEVKINSMEKSPFFIRPYHVVEDKNFTDKEMKHLHYWGILKEGFSAYSSPIMLISRKVTQDKRVVKDFRHLYIRIAKNNLAYPLLKDTFSVLGSPRHEVLSVLDLKMHFTHLDYQRILRDIAEYFHILVAHHICIKECLWDWIYYLQIGNPILMLYSSVYRAEILWSNYGWSYYYSLHQITHSKIRRPIKGIIKEWT